jgi:hypothetical protein
VLLWLHCGVRHPRAQLSRRAGMLLPPRLPPYNPSLAQRNAVMTAALLLLLLVLAGRRVGVRAG